MWANVKPPSPSTLTHRQTERERERERERVKDITPSIAWRREVWKEETLDDLP